MSTPQISSVTNTLISDPKELQTKLRDQRAAKGAQEFEASLFGTVLEKMEKNLSIEDEQDNDAGHDTWGAMGVKAVSEALAQRHVLGIANMIEHTLGLKSAGTSPVSGSSPAEGSAINK